MNQQQFTDLYRAACDERNTCRTDPRLRPWFNGLPSYPPVLGFGLPENGRRIPLVTIGLNPSSEEFSGPLQIVDDAEIQYEAQTHYFERQPYRWFGPAAEFLRGATNNALSYVSDPGGAHLDLVPIATRPFDSVYDQEASEEERAAASKMLERSIRSTLLPLLGLLARHHATQAVVIFGFLPRPGGGGDRGSHTMRDVFGKSQAFRLEARDDQGAMPLGRGGFNLQSPWFKEGIGLHKLVVIFVPRGPSSRAAARELPEAGLHLRTLGWLNGIIS